MSHLSKTNKNNLFFNWLAVFVGLELLSWLSYHFTDINWPVLALLALITLILVGLRPMYAIYIPLAELFWGSLGHSFDYSWLSTRLVIFAAVAIYFIFGYFWRINKIKFFRDRTMLILWSIIVLIILAGLGLGYYHKYPWQNIFLDANAYLYIFYLPIWYQTYEPRELKNIFIILQAAALVIAVKTIILFNIFVQDYKFLDINAIYKWVRDSRTGEITTMPNGFSRIFMQSQFYLLLAWFYMFLRQIKDYRSKKNFLFLVLISAAILISLSRSFWLGAAVGLLFVLVLIFFYQRRYISPLVFLFLIGLGLSSWISVQIFFNVPHWQSLYYFVDRGTTSQEPAADSRAALLPVMWQSIKEQPIVGYGYGKELTYQSSDPRIKNHDNPEGWHTTYAFEWGWLDMWLKVGILLPTCILGWLWLIYKRGYHFISKHAIVGFSLLSIITSLIIIHMFSPYINHPLGLGLMMLATIIFTIHETRQTYSYH